MLGDGRRGGARSRTTKGLQLTCRSRVRAVERASSGLRSPRWPSPCRRAGRRARRKGQGPVTSSCSAINDFHGHLGPTPGSSSRRSTRLDTATPACRSADRAVPAALEYFATHVRALRAGQSEHASSSSAGDLIGASPLISALFHDEPTIEAMNTIGLDVNGVGNHEFDEGDRRAAAHADGGCHPTATAATRTAPDGRFDGATSTTSPPTWSTRGTGRTLFPPYAIQKFERREDRLHRHDPRGHADIVSPSRHRGPRVPRRGRRPPTATCRELQAASTASRRSSCCCTRAASSTRRLADRRRTDGLQRTSPAARLHGAIVASRPARRAVDLFVTGHTHQAYNCRDRPASWSPARPRSAASITDIDLELDRRAERRRRTVDGRQRDRHPRRRRRTPA